MSLSSSLPQEIIIVLGMHRSGTSMLSNVLAAAGGSHGKWLQEVDSHNPRGYGENARLVAFHEEMLKALGSSWIDPRLPPEGLDRSPDFNEKLDYVLRMEFDGQARAVIKDPRMCRMLPLWKRFLSQSSTQTSFLITVRHPLEVADSLARRDNVSPEWALMSWMQHTLLAERGTRQEGRAVTTYARLLSHPFEECQKLFQFLGWTSEPGPCLGEIDLSLRHSHHPADDSFPPHPLAEDALHLWEQAKLGFPPESAALLDAILDRYVQAVSAFPPESAIHPEIVRVFWQKHLNGLQAEWENQRATIEASLRAMEQHYLAEQQEQQQQMEKLVASVQNLKQKVKTSLAEGKEAQKEKKNLLKAVDRWNQKSWFSRALHRVRLPGQK